MKAEQNELITRVGPGTPCGEVLRRYWQPVALVDEFNPALDPRMAQRPVKAVRIMGQDLVLFKDAQDRWGLLDRDCPHRGADLSFGRHEGDGLRCPFHGWKFAVDGTCLQTPAEPTGSKLCERIRQRHYPVTEQCGVGIIQHAAVALKKRGPVEFFEPVHAPGHPVDAMAIRICQAGRGETNAKLLPGLRFEFLHDLTHGEGEARCVAVELTIASGFRKRGEGAGTGCVH